MAKKKVSSSVVDLSKDISSLLNGTSGELVSNSTTMHGRPYVPTPIPQLNCMLGGGLPLSVAVEAFGEPASGKTTTMYETMGNFQEKFTNGISIIVDSEASVDEQRMSYMGVDPSRVVRLDGSTVDSGFRELFKVLDNILQASGDDYDKVPPIMVIWDTISQGNTDAQYENKDPNAGRMMEKAKTLKTQLGNLMPYFSKIDLLVVLLNQVTTKMTRFGASLDSSGGWGIKHSVQLRLRYRKNGDPDAEGIWATYQHSTIDMVKSKLSPLFKNISVTLDISNAGRCDKNRTMLDYIANAQLPYLTAKGGWWNCHEIANRYPEYVGYFDKFVVSEGANFRASELSEYMESNPYFLKLFQLAFIDDIAKHYSYQGEVSKPFHDKLVSELTTYKQSVDDKNNVEVKKESVKSEDSDNEDDNSDDTASSDKTSETS